MSTSTLLGYSGDHADVLFDYCVSNPPYQKDVAKKQNRTSTSVDIFPLFHTISQKLCNTITMIYPAGWQKNISSGFGGWLYNNGLFSSENYNVQDVFDKSVERGFVVSVVSTNCRYKRDILVNGSPRDRDVPVWISTQAADILYRRTREWSNGYLGGVSKLTTLRNLQVDNIMVLDDVSSDDDVVMVYVKQKPGKQADAKFFPVEKSVLLPHVADNTKCFHYGKYNVVTRDAILGRQPLFSRMMGDQGSILSRVLSPDEVSGVTWMSVRWFDTEEEANNFSKYLNSKPVSFLIGLDYSRRSFAGFVPDLGDYTNNNTDIQWDLPLDKQVCNVFGLSDEEYDKVDKTHL